MEEPSGRSFAWGNRVLVLQKSTNTFIKDIPMDALLPGTLLKLPKFILIVYLSRCLLNKWIWSSTQADTPYVQTLASIRIPTSLNASRWITEKLSSKAYYRNKVV